MSILLWLFLFYLIGVAIFWVVRVVDARIALIRATQVRIVDHISGVEESVKQYAKDNAKALRALRKASTAEGIQIPVYMTEQDRHNEAANLLLTRQAELRRRQYEEDPVPINRRNGGGRGPIPLNLDEALAFLRQGRPPLPKKDDDIEMDEFVDPPIGKKKSKRVRRAGRDRKQKRWVPDHDDEETPIDF